MSPTIDAQGGAELPQFSLPTSDDDRTPMTRTELAMLWDGINQWISTHPATYHPTLSILDLRDHIDAELTARFGG